MNEFDKEKLIEKDIKSVENRIRHAFNQGYEAGLKHGREQEPKIDMESEDIKTLQKRAHLEGFHEALKMSVKQEPLTDVLDKIKADVERIEISGRIDEHNSFIRTGEHIKHMVIEIIDNYYREEQTEQIVIDIDKNVFTRLFDKGTEDYAIVNDDLFAIAKSIRNSTPLTEVLDKIKAEIMRVANQEKSHDSKWALGLSYADKIIDKYKWD